MKILREKVDFASMTTDKLIEWIETHPGDTRSRSQIVDIISARSRRAREEMDKTIHELGVKALAYLNSLGIDILDDDNDNDLPILLEENVGEQEQ